MHARRQANVPAGRDDATTFTEMDRNKIRIRKMGNPRRDVARARATALIHGRDRYSHRIDAVHGSSGTS